MSKYKHGGFSKEENRKLNQERRGSFIVYWRRLKLSAIALLGGKCVRCGIEDERVLQFDHIKGGGVKESRTRTTNHYKNIIESVIKKENKFQLLCANCNWIKRVENKEVRHI